MKTFNKIMDVILIIGRQLVVLFFGINGVVEFTDCFWSTEGGLICLVVIPMMIVVIARSAVNEISIRLNKERKTEEK